MSEEADLTIPQGAQEKRIYKIDTFVNQDGFKIETHNPVDDPSIIPQFYGFYLVNTDLGPIDRYFKFQDKSSVEECFEIFRPMAEADAERLADDMQAEAQRLDALELEESVERAAMALPPTVIPDKESEEDGEPQNMPHVKEDTATT